MDKKVGHRLRDQVFLLSHSILRLGEAISDLYIVRGIGEMKKEKGESKETGSAGEGRG